MTRITVPHDELAAFCRRHHIRKLSLFGSVLRDDFRPDSDVDVLVEFEPGHSVGWEIVDMEDELSICSAGTRWTLCRRSFSIGDCGIEYSTAPRCSMPKDDYVYVGHMLETANAVVAKTAGISRSDFDGNENLRLAVTHLIQTVGESARRVSHEFRQLHPDIPWGNIVAMRHKVMHDYLEINYDIVWRVATESLPSLMDELDKLLPHDIPRKEPPA